jgi:uncharacterized protein YceK
MNLARTARLGILLLLSGCSTASFTAREAATGSPALEIAGFVIRNELAFPVTDVLIEVPATGAFGGCGNILPRSDCRTSFEQVDYAANAMIVRWKEYGQQHQTPEFVIDVPDGLDPAVPAWIEVRIYMMGQAGATLIQ